MWVGGRKNTKIYAHHSVIALNQNPLFVLALMDSKFPALKYYIKLHSR